MLMKALLKKPAVFGIVLTASVVAASGIAWAYWTAAGTGTASGTTSAGTTITFTGTYDTAPAPGKTSPITFTATTAANTGGNIRVGTITLTGVDSDDNNCDTEITTGGNTINATNGFTMANLVSNETIAADGAGHVLTAKGQLVFHDDPATNQSDCKNKTISLTFTSS